MATRHLPPLPPQAARTEAKPQHPRKEKNTVKLADFCAEKNFPVFPLDGEFHRFDRGGTLNGWFVGREVNVAGQKVAVARFGDWRTQEKWEWKGGTEGLDDAVVGRALAQADAEMHAAREVEQERVSAEVTEYWEDATCLGTTAYMQKKSIPRLFSAKIDWNDGQTLLVPAMDLHGKIWSLQRIGADGSKRFWPGGKLKGMMCAVQWGTVLSVQDGKGPIYVAEGWATAASIALALGSDANVVAAFHAGNLERVGQALREAYPQAELIYCADNDQWTRHPDGSPWNPGVEAALRAVHATGGRLVAPHFDVVDERPTDFNDLHRLAGLDVVRDQLARADKPGSSDRHIEVSSPAPARTREGSTPWEGVDPLPIVRTKQGAIKLPEQQHVVDHLLAHIGPGIVKQDRDLFVYVGTHWKNLGLAHLDGIRQAIQRVCSGHAKVDYVDACLKLLTYTVPHVPEGIDMFRPHEFAVNFLNGTLWVNKLGRDERVLEFREHRPTDYLINVLPYEYREGAVEKNAEFEAMLGRVFEGDADAEEKVRAVRQMYGACLAPCFPHLFMCYGPGGTGKSTVLKIAARLVSPENLCSVAPSEFVEFNMETMVGKLVNIDTDIPLDEPIRDAIAKKVEDRTGVRINRKGKIQVYAPLPAVHLFGGNAIPRTLDGASRAHDRRWTFIGFEKHVAKGNYPKDYWDWCFEQSPQGILNFALDGLRDLLANNGHFTVPASGRVKMDEWQRAADPVGRFLDDLREGEVSDSNTKIFEGEDHRIARPKLWTLFVEWHKTVQNRPPALGRTTFYNALRERKIPEKVIDGVRYFHGIGAGVQGSATH
jgi:phage/plasmid primase-like uncharacterized protein